MRSLETYAIENLNVSQIILPESDWVGFLGVDKKENEEEEKEDL